MNSQLDFRELATLSKTLGEAPEFFRKKAEEDLCDKFGFGFNLDDRFSHFSGRISLDGWAGYYGNSSCYRLFVLSSPTTVFDAFVEVLNKNRDDILRQMANVLAADAESKRAKHIADLKAKLVEAETFEGGAS